MRLHLRLHARGVLSRDSCLRSVSHSLHHRQLSQETKNRLIPLHTNGSVHSGLYLTLLLCALLLLWTTPVPQDPANLILYCLPAASHLLPDLHLGDFQVDSDLAHDGLKHKRWTTVRAWTAQETSSDLFSRMGFALGHLAYTRVPDYSR